MPMPPALLQRDYPHVHTYVDNNEAYGLGGGIARSAGIRPSGVLFRRSAVTFDTPPPPVIYIYLNPLDQPALWHS